MTKTERQVQRPDAVTTIRRNPNRERVAVGRAAVSQILDDWRQVRAELRAIEEVEHPDFTDVLGRVWTWANKDLYTHDKMAWTRSMIERSDMGLPGEYALDDPNYRWCSICKAGRRP